MPGCTGAERPVGRDARMGGAARKDQQMDDKEILRNIDDLIKTEHGLRSRLAAGELTFRIGRAFPADYEKLRHDFNGAIAQLQDTLKVINAATSMITLTPSTTPNTVSALRILCVRSVSIACFRFSPYACAISF